MAKANLPLIRANSDTIIQRMAFGLDDVEIFMSVVWAADRTTQNDFRIYLTTAQIFCAFTIAGYIIYSGLLEDISDDSDNEYDSDVEWLCNGGLQLV